MLSYFVSLTISLLNILFLLVFLLPFHQKIVLNFVSLTISLKTLFLLIFLNSKFLFKMASSSSYNIEDMMDEKFDQIFDQQFETLFIHNDDRQEVSRSKKKWAYIERQWEQGHM